MAGRPALDEAAGVTTTSSTDRLEAFHSQAG